MMSRRTVLVVEGEPALRNSLGHALRRRGYQVLAAADGSLAVELLGRDTPDALVVAMLLPGASGFELVRTVKERWAEVPVVMTAPSAAAHADYALALGADRFLAAPYTPDEVGAVVEAVCPPPVARPSGSGSAPRPTPARS